MRKNLLAVAVCIIALGSFAGHAQTPSKIAVVDTETFTDTKAGVKKLVAAYEPLLFAGQPGADEIRRTLTTMQEQIRAGRIGQAVMLSVHETVLDAARRGQLPTWLASMVHRIPVPLGNLALVGAGALVAALVVVGIGLLFLRGATAVEELRTT